MPHEQQRQQQQQQQHHQLQSEATYETRQKRSQLDLGSIGGGIGNGFGSAAEYKDFNEFMEELGDNAIMPVSQEMDLENMPPLLYFMLLQKLKQCRLNKYIFLDYFCFINLHIYRESNNYFQFSLPFLLYTIAL